MAGDDNKLAGIQKKERKKEREREMGVPLIIFYQPEVKS
jgi:hypothetical protein